MRCFTTHSHTSNSQGKSRLHARVHIELDNNEQVKKQLVHESTQKQARATRTLNRGARLGAAVSLAEAGPTQDKANRAMYYMLAEHT